jgi:branched-chain amino acid transport system permease protein
MTITQNLMNSPTGRAMLAMKNSTSAAQAFGVSLMKYRLLAFTISIVYASVAGVLYMLYVRYVSNSSSTLFTLSTSLNILGAVIIGGTKSIWGTIGGTFIIYGIDKMFLQDIAFFRENPTLITLFCGILVVVVVMFYPGGLVQLVTEIRLKITQAKRKRKEARYGKELG